MKIALLDVDGHNFPNLALMKISSYHKNHGDSVEFAKEKKYYDIIYKSKVFTFTPDSELKYNAKKEIKGGSGYNLSINLPKKIDHMTPDYSIYKCEHAYGFLTRGCPNKCSWCIVPMKEGNIKAYMDIDDFISNKKSAILMDNNVLSSDHGIKQIEKIISRKIKIDFNQGLDARLIDDSMAKLLAKVKWLHTIRLACDNQSSMKYIVEAVKHLRWRNARPQRYFVYCLVNDTKEAMERVKFLKGIYCEPFCQPYRDFENKIEPTKSSKRFSRWVNQTRVFNSVYWEDYKYK